jgi:hypothetical protein
MKSVNCFACLLTTIGGFYGGMTAAAQAQQFYHSTALEYAMDIIGASATGPVMVANGFKLLKPQNSSELGLGFYVTRKEVLAGSYGDTYLVVTSALTDDQIKGCTDYDKLYADAENQSHQKFRDAIQANKSANGFDGWWKNPELIPLDLNGPYKPPATWLKTGVNESPACVTRNSFGNQIKFNFNLSLANGKEPPWETKPDLKGKPEIKSVCYKPQGTTKFDCHSVEEFRNSFARKWANQKLSAKLGNQGVLQKQLQNAVFK